MQSQQQKEKLKFTLYKTLKPKKCVFLKPSTISIETRRIPETTNFTVSQHFIVEIYFFF